MIGKDCPCDPRFVLIGLLLLLCDVSKSSNLGTITQTLIAFTAASNLQVGIRCLVNYFCMSNFNISLKGPRRICYNSLPIIPKLEVIQPTLVTLICFLFQWIQNHHISRLDSRFWIVLFMLYLLLFDTALIWVFLSEILWSHLSKFDWVIWGETAK